MKQRLVLTIALLVLFTGVLAPASTQEETCPIIVQEAMNTVGDACSVLNRDEACYGNHQVQAEFWDTAGPPSFSAPADRVALVDLKQVIASPLNPEQQTWGMAVLNLQANLPDLAPGQTVLFLLMGDVSVENAIPPSEAAASIVGVPLKVAADTELHRCPVPDAPVVDTAPAGSDLLLIGRGAAGEWYEVWRDANHNAWLPSAAVTDTSNLNTLPVTFGPDSPPRCGAMQAFRFTAGLGVPRCQEAPNSLVVQTPQDVEVAFDVNGLSVTVGSTVAFSAFENPSADGTEPVMLITLMEGDLKAEFKRSQTAHGPAGVPGALTCACTTKVETQKPGMTFAITLDEAGNIGPDAELVPFQGNHALVQTLIQNVCANANESGAVSRSFGCGFNLIFHEPCSATGQGNINQRGGPSTAYTAEGMLASGTSAEVNGRTTGADGFTWWRLSAGGWPCLWVRDDVVQTAGTCENVPEIDLNDLPPPPQYTPPSSGGSAPPPSGGSASEGVIPVYNCTSLGNGQYQWYEAKQMTVPGVGTFIETTGGPYKGPWQPGCPSGGPVCGNGVVESGEQCDPPDGVSCNAYCQYQTSGTH